MFSKKKSEEKDTSEKSSGSKDQISFRPGEELKNAFNSKVKGKGRSATGILVNFINAYLADDPAALAIADGKSFQPAEVAGAPVRLPANVVPCPPHIRAQVTEFIKMIEDPAKLESFQAGMAMAKATRYSVKEDE